MYCATLRLQTDGLHIESNDLSSSLVVIINHVRE